jgi:ABC-type multidrug transport system fused ATPase/permease subunit
MINYLSKVFAILAEAKRRLIPLLLLLTIASVLETVSIGLIGPFLSLATKPKVVEDSELLKWVYRASRARSVGEFIFILGVFITVLFCIKGLFYFWTRVYIIRFGFNQKNILISKLLHTYLVISYTFHLSRNTSTLIKNIILETEQFTHACLLPLLNAVANFVVMMVMLLLLAKTDIVLLSLMLGILLPLFVLFQRISKQFSIWGKTLSDTHQEMIRIINHSLSGIKETRIIGCEPYFELQMAEQSRLHSKAATFYYSADLLPRVSIETTLIVFLVLFISISQLNAGSGMENLVSILGVFAIGSMRMIPSVTQFFQALSQMRGSSHAVDVLYLDLKEIEYCQKDQTVPVRLLAKSMDSTHVEYVQAKHAAVNLYRPPAQPARSSVGLIEPLPARSTNRASFTYQVELDQIKYAYPGTSELSIDNISLTLWKGQSIAFIGKSGAGKTTLVDIILGLLQPSSGDIRLDGVSIYHDLRAWQNLIGYIPQTIALLDDTIERNIAFGIPDELIDATRLQKAIQAAQLEDLIQQLPEGIKTSVGERGVRLSGGQRQRIGIARALYFEREILVLDEATSALDNETESLVTEAIRSLAKRKTMIIIAHRLSTVQHCDRIYVLEKGQIVKLGSYEEVVLASSSVVNSTTA